MRRLHDDEELSRLDDLADADDRARDASDADDPIRGAAAFCARTVSDGAYPTQAGKCFKVEILAVTGDEAEGGTPTKTPTGTYRYAFHVGSTAPPQGTEVIAISVPDRFVFLF